MHLEYPAVETYDDVVCDVMAVDAGGEPVDVLRYMPAAGGPHPAIVMGQDGTGCTSMNRRVAATLAHHGVVVLVPDYYRGGGPADPEAMDDLMGLMERIGAIDWVAEMRLFHASIDTARALPEVDGERIGVWGYCTGGTFALLAACLRRDLKAAVLYYPSQPRMAPIDDRRPVHPIDLLWNISCPALLLYGDADVVMPPEQLDEVRRRIDAWHVDMTVETFPGAGHAFSTPAEGFLHPEADRRAWEVASAFVAHHLDVPA